MKQKTVKTGVVVEGLDMQAYRGIEDPRHVAGRTSRSVSEAFKDASYACAIERHRGDWYEAVRWFHDLFMFFFWAGCAIAFPILFVLWLTK
jgi:hypothetical protein